VFATVRSTTSTSRIKVGAGSWTSKLLRVEKVRCIRSAHEGCLVWVCGG
jgi:hypothetical protein